MSNLNAEISALFDLKNAIAEVDKTLKDLKQERDDKEFAILQLMEAQGISETGVDGVGKVFSKPKTYFSYDKAIEPEIIAYFKNDEQLRPFVTETIHPKPFQKAVEGLYSEKNILPPNVKMFATTELSTRKASEKAD